MSGDTDVRERVAGAALPCRGPAAWGAPRVPGSSFPCRSLPGRLFVYLASCCFQAEGEYLKANCLKSVEWIHIYGKKKKKKKTQTQNLKNLLQPVFSNLPFPSPESTHRFSKCCKAHYFPPCHIIHPSIKDGS